MRLRVHEFTLKHEVVFITGIVIHFNVQARLQNSQQSSIIEVRMKFATGAQKRHLAVRSKLLLRQA